MAGSGRADADTAVHVFDLDDDRRRRTRGQA
jgi:hypothetical protein